MDFGERGILGREGVCGPFVSRRKGTTCREGKSYKYDWICIPSRIFGRISSWVKSNFMRPAGFVENDGAARNAGFVWKACVEGKLGVAVTP